MDRSQNAPLKDLPTPSQRPSQSAIFPSGPQTYHSPHKHYRPKKKSGGINFGKDYSMITDYNVSRIIFAKITETMGL